VKIFKGFWAEDERKSLVASEESARSDYCSGRESFLFSSADEDEVQQRSSVTHSHGWRKKETRWSGVKGEKERKRKGMDINVQAGRQPLFLSLSLLL